MSAIRSSSSRVLRAFQRPVALTQSSYRPYSSSGDTIGGNKTHTTDKPAHDVQSTPSNQAREGKGKNDNSGAVEEKDPHNSNERAAKESKAPGNTVIGMNDERGGKGMD